MFETSGGSPTLGAYGDCCSCCAKVRVATPPSANTLAPQTTSVLFIVASLCARERFPIVHSNLTQQKRSLHPPIYRRAMRISVCSCVGVEGALAYNPPAAQRRRQVAHT